MQRIALVLIALLLLLPSASRGQGGGRAGLVVRYGDGTIRTSCVQFNGDSISGLELLERGGVDVIAQTSGNNAAVCKIGGDGCDYPAETCFCKTGAGGSGEYWAFWRLVDGAWQYSVQGAGVARVRDGDVNGWAWGAGSVERGAEPPLQTFAQICPVAEAVTAQPTLPLISEAATAQPTPQPVRAAPEAQAAGGASPAPPNRSIGSYVMFGFMLAVIVGMIIFVQRRRA